MVFSLLVWFGLLVCWFLCKGFGVLAFFFLRPRFSVSALNTFLASVGLFFYGVSTVSLRFS